MDEAASLRPGAGEPFDPEGVSWSRVSPALTKVRALSLMLTALLPVVGCAVAAVLWLAWFWVGVLVVLALVGWALWVIRRQVAALGYAERDEDLLIRRGVLFREIVVVPYGRMQYVDVKAGPLDRAFGVARVQLHTASAGTDAQIPGLPPEEASTLRDRLASRGQAQLAGL